ncbi:BTB/POZ protein [Pavlovales sp. CCMP2436]|nr:BTB/POZ protein [Pavlovales sp. CCMP2436]
MAAASSAASSSLDLDGLQAAIDGLKEQRRAVDRDRVAVDTLKEVVEFNLERFKHRVKLNVGGMLFETSLSTLQYFPDSMLGTMFSGREGIEVPTDEQGYVFIDRDGTHFRTILNFLRTGKVRTPIGKAAREELAEEAGFYLLQDQMARSGDGQAAEGDDCMIM